MSGIGAISTAQAGLVASLRDMASVAQLIASAPTSSDLPEKMVALIADQRAAEANLATIKTVEQMAGSLLDVVG